MLSLSFVYETPFFSQGWKRKAFWAVLETIKLATVALFLNTLSHLCLQNSVSASPLLNHFFIVVQAPLFEEVIFRGFLLSGIHALQKGWNRVILKRELTKEEETIQRLFRIHVSAFIFALIHYLEKIPFLLSTKKLVCLTLLSYFAGVLYGHLTEKSHTLSVSFLAHGIHNLLTRKLSSSSLAIAMVINKLFFCLFLG